MCAAVDPKTMRYRVILTLPASPVSYEGEGATIAEAQANAHARARLTLGDATPPMEGFEALHVQHATTFPWSKP